MFLFEISKLSLSETPANGWDNVYNENGQDFDFC